MSYIGQAPLVAKVTSADIQDGTIAGVDIAPGAVTGTVLAPGAVGTTNIAAGAVGATELAASAVGNAAIAAGAVTADKLSIVFYENDQTILADYTITAGRNAMSAGPITINTGVTVTIPTGSIWSIV